MNIDIEPGFTGVDAEVDFRLSAWFGQLLALHAGLAPHHLFRTGAKDGRTKLSHGSGPGLHGPARPILGWVATHPRISPILSRFGPSATCKGCKALARSKIELRRSWVRGLLPARTQTLRDRDTWQ